MSSCLTALLGPVEVGLGALGVPRAGDRDDDVLDRDQILDGHLAVEWDDLCAAVLAVLLDDHEQLVADDRSLPLLLVDDVLEVRDLGLDRRQLVGDFLPFQGGEPAQLQLQDRVRLHLVDVQQADQAGACDLHRLRPPDQRDDLV